MLCALLGSSGRETYTELFGILLSLLCMCLKSSWTPNWNNLSLNSKPNARPPRRELSVKDSSRKHDSSVRKCLRRCHNDESQRRPINLSCFSAFLQLAKRTTAHFLGSDRESSGFCRKTERRQKPCFQRMRPICAHHNWEAVREIALHLCRTF